MSPAFEDHLRRTLSEIDANGLRKRERLITTPQDAHVRVDGGKPLLNLCANNYLGLADHPRLIEAARRALDDWGFGLASVRFICGTQQIHRQLENAISAFLRTEDTLLYSSCFDANGGLFETLLSEADAVISDELNHASIIDGIRLCKATRLRYRNNDMADLSARLAEASHARFKLIATDGVFSMDGRIANLAAICDLADKAGALVMVDDSHAVGFMGKTGRGTHEYSGVMGRVDIITGTLGKALGGASGGYTSGRQPIIDLLRQRSRPYLFSNSVAPPIVGATLEALKLVSESTALRDRLWDNTRFFRKALAERGFEISSDEHPIVPVILGDAVRAVKVAESMFQRGVYAVAFSYPVVPIGRARIRTQVSATHSQDDLQFAAQTLAEACAEVT
jgi:glycine C-acetyltransferase